MTCGRPDPPAAGSMKTTTPALTPTSSAAEKTQNTRPSNCASTVEWPRPRTAVTSSRTRSKRHSSSACVVVLTAATKTPTTSASTMCMIHRMSCGRPSSWFASFSPTACGSLDASATISLATAPPSAWWPSWSSSTADVLLPLWSTKLLLLRLLPWWAAVAARAAADEAGGAAGAVSGVSVRCLCCGSAAAPASRTIRARRLRLRKAAYGAVCDLWNSIDSYDDSFSICSSEIIVSSSSLCARTSAAKRATASHAATA